jgi:tetratricopeptide (TPR) repeat protein
MSQTPGGKNFRGLPDPNVVPSVDGEPRPAPLVRLDVEASDRSQQAALGTGTQHNYFGGIPSEAETPVSIAFPAGQRDERFPLRGRDKLLSELLAVSSGPGVRVIHGMGGCGKTSLALEAAHLALQRGVEVWWVSAAEKFRFLAGMRALGRRLGVADDELRHGEAADLLWRRLSGWSQEWLLVIDNADDPQILAGPGLRTADGTGWLRPVASRAGLILVTSRDGNAGSWGPWCRLYPIGMLAAEEAAKLLVDRTGVHHDSLGGNVGAESLADRLGRLPLALRIAGSFLAELAEIPSAFADPAQIRSYIQYRERLEQGDLHAVFPSRTPGTLTPDQARGIIDRTWELTLDQLESRQFPEARRLLRLLACLADAPIPYELLLHPPTLASSPLFTDITGPRLWQVLQALAGFGLIELTGGQDQVAPRVIRLHPLVRDTSRADSNGSEQEDYLMLAADLAGAAAILGAAGSPEDPHTWPRWQALAPHALHVFEAITATADYRDEALIAAAYAADKAAGYQATQGLISPSEATHRAVLQARLRTLGADHPDTIDTRHSIARRLSERADYGHAETEYREVLESMRRILGPDHPDTLTVQHNIASLVSFRGDYARAEAEYRDVLAIKLRALSRDHRDTLITRHEIARMMREQGHYAEAEAEFRSVLEDRINTLGADHYNTLITRSALALTIAAHGHYARAEAEFRDILTAQLRLLGPEHLRTLWTRQHIALMMAAQGDYTGAENELHDVLARREPRIPDHPDSLTARHELARIMAAKGNASEARTELQDILTAKIRVLGLDHPSTALTAREIQSLTGSQNNSPYGTANPSEEPNNLT